MKRLSQGHLSLGLFVNWLISLDDSVGLLRFFPTQKRSKMLLLYYPITRYEDAVSGTLSLGLAWIGWFRLMTRSHFRGPWKVFQEKLVGLSWWINSKITFVVLWKSRRRSQGMVVDVSEIQDCLRGKHRHGHSQCRDLHNWWSYFCGLCPSVWDVFLWSWNSKSHTCWNIFDRILKKDQGSPETFLFSLELVHSKSDQI